MAGHPAIFQRLLLGWGKVRRFYLHGLRGGYIEKSHERRSGECRRCGACCKLMFVCPSLDLTKNPIECKRHETRARNCRVFPIDERDIRDRDIMMPEQACGYSFSADGGKAQGKNARA